MYISILGVWKRTDHTRGSETGLIWHSVYINVIDILVTKLMNIDYFILHVRILYICKHIIIKYNIYLFEKFELSFEYFQIFWIRQIWLTNFILWMQMDMENRTALKMKVKYPEHPIDKMFYDPPRSEKFKHKNRIYPIEKCTDINTNSMLL